MTKSLHILLIATAAWLSAACTHNNGDIGPLFGEWTLTELTIDGQPQDFPVEQGCVWAFQGDIVSIYLLEPNHDAQYRWGTWTRTDSPPTLTLYFTHSDAGNFQPPAWLPMAQVNPLTISRITSSELVLEATDADGRHIVYRLQKQW